MGLIIYLAHAAVTILVAIAVGWITLYFMAAVNLNLQFHEWAIANEDWVTAIFFTVAITTYGLLNENKQTRR